MSWSSLKTPAIVLRTHAFREADRRYHLLTPDHGKIECVGRGAQKIKAKLAPAIEPFVLLDIELIRGRQSNTIIAAERRQAFPSLANDLIARNLADISGFFIDQFTREYDTHPELYFYYAAWLKQLNDIPVESYTRSVFLLGGFLLQVLGHLGYEAQLNYCVHCEQPIMPLSFRWHGGKGGLVCSDCVSSDGQEWFAAKKIDEEVIRIMRFARHAPTADLHRIHLPGALVVTFSEIIDDLVKFHVPGAKETPFWQHLINLT